VKLPDSIQVIERGWLSANNVVLHERDEAVVVDSGYGAHAAQTVALIERALSGKRLARLVNTHCHSDHMGGNAAIQRKFGCRTSIPGGEAPLIERWDEHALFLAIADQRAERFHYEDTFCDGDALQMGGLEWRVIAAPGHDTHAVMFYSPEARVLISGDALWENGFGVVFPQLFGRGRIWRADTIITRSGVKIKGVGGDQPFRGMRHGSKRPDLVIGDDIENDEAVESADQRKKLERKVFKKVMKLGQKDTVYIFEGTILHYDSLLSNLLKKPGWKGRKFKAVLRFSKSSLWEQWENIFVDISIGKEAAEVAADQFFEAHAAEMLEGTEVLWPEVEDYYYLMKMRISDGPSYFDSEKQNEPINPEDCLFQEGWFTYWDDGEVNLAGIPHYGVVDPSMGKRSKKHDPSAIIAGRFKDNILWIDIADIDKRHPDKIIDDILLYHEKDKFQAFGVESIQFQEYFANTLEKEAHKRNRTLNVIEIMPHTDKRLRIETLQPWIKNGWIRFKKNHRTLVEQLKYYPMADHDDGPDALEQLKSMIEKNIGGPIEYQTTGVKREFTRMESYMR